MRSSESRDLESQWIILMGHINSITSCEHRIQGDESLWFPYHGVIKVHSVKLAEFLKSTIGDMTNRSPKANVAEVIDIMVMEGKTCVNDDMNDTAGHMFSLQTH